MKAGRDDRFPLAPSAEDRAWARGVLGVPADAAGEQEQAAVLSRLEEAGFVPPPQWEQAIFLLAANAPRGLFMRQRAEELFRPREMALKAEVDRPGERVFLVAAGRSGTRVGGP